MTRRLALLLLALAVSCARAQVAVVDDTGARVALARPATRIVSLAPHATELLYAAGAGGAIVGTVDTSDFPPPAKAIPRIGDARALDLERIVLLAPDLVVTWPWTAPAQVEALRARGVPVFTTRPATIEGIAGDIERLGELTGHAEIATLAATAFRARLSALRARYVAATRVRVFYEIWDAPLYTIGGGHLITQALATCGGENVFASLALPAPAVDVEAVLAARPDAIIAGVEGGGRPAWLDRWRRWPALPAVARGHLFVVDADLLHRPGPRFLEGAEVLCAAVDRART